MLPGDELGSIDGPLPRVPQFTPDESLISSTQKIPCFSGFHSVHGHLPSRRRAAEPGARPLV
ncbi:hypothetical protein NSK11_contig00040-0002 [Nocardia seriolae]|uniref:Uncharacterized protein n=1 Tax=Nocardia seriolae TaxID=37332 RepID=A0ABC9YTC2_9NOCA|nr:hypothetical protein NS07_v2contig00037-0043 [Nocardia seriolae]GAP28648.1 hypothetical protein NSK11_contig00040-0002 [Nocardia seriolae]